MLHDAISRFGWGYDYTIDSISYVKLRLLLRQPLPGVPGSEIMGTAKMALIEDLIAAEEGLDV